MVDTLDFLMLYILGVPKKSWWCLKVLRLSWWVVNGNQSYFFRVILLICYRWREFCCRSMTGVSESWVVIWKLIVQRIYLKWLIAKFKNEILITYGMNRETQPIFTQQNFIYLDFTIYLMAEILKNCIEEAYH